MCRETVSVIVPYYRASETIVRAVKSALGQTVRPDEIIIVDDGSPDDAATATKEFGSSVTLICKPNGGAASARNLGIEHANGDWIAFLDADDYWEPSKLERQLAFSEGVGLVGGGWFTEIPGQPRCIAKISQPAFFSRKFKPHDAEVFHVAMNLWTSTLIVRRTVLGDQRFDVDLDVAEDRDLWIRLVESTAVYLVPEPLATYVQWPGSLSNSDSDRDCRNMLKVLYRHAALLGPKEVREQVAIVYRQWAGRQLANGKPRSAISPAARRLAIEPASPQAWWIMCKSLARSILP
jgi:glycosyltransferase involved in cell wall biosynthesis